MYLVANSFLHSLASGFYLFLSYGYSIRNYEHCRKLMKLQRILLVFGLRKSAERCGFIAGMRVREIYIGDFSNISAQLELYRRFSQYIGATQIISAIFRLYRLNKRRGRSQTASSLYFEAPPEQSSLPLSCYKLKQFRYAVQQSSAQSIILNRYLLRFLPLLYPPYKTIKNTIHFFFFHADSVIGYRDYNARL